MEIVKCKYEIIDNILTIIPEDGIKDNSLYEIRLNNVKSFDGTAEINGLVKKIVTQITPAYCKISDVAILIDMFNIPETTILYYIREASKYVDYIKAGGSTSSASQTNNSEITFPMQMFVRTKVMLDCLLKAYVSKAAGSGVKGKLGEISFENTEKYETSISDLINALKGDLKKWEDALKGYELEGRAKPKFAKLGSNTSEATAFSSIVDSIERDLPTGV